MADVLIDTGPIVAILNSRDRDHRACGKFLAGFRGRFITTEAVLTEVLYLLGSRSGGSEAGLDFFIRGGAVLVPQSTASLIRARQLIGRYEDVPMDLADATLVTLAEESGTTRIWTLDRRGFSVYRPAPRKSFEILPGRFRDGAGDSGDL